MTVPSCSITWQQTGHGESGKQRIKERQLGLGREKNLEQKLGRTSGSQIARSCLGQQEVFLFLCCNLQNVIKGGDLGCMKRWHLGKSLCFSCLLAQWIVLWPFWCSGANFEALHCPLHCMFCYECPLGWCDSGLGQWLELGGRISKIEARVHWNRVGWRGSGVAYRHSCSELHTRNSGANKQAKQ